MPPQLRRRIAGTGGGMQTAAGETRWEFLAGGTDADGSYGKGAEGGKQIGFGRRRSRGRQGSKSRSRIKVRKRIKRMRKRKIRIRSRQETPSAWTLRSRLSGQTRQLPP